MCALYNEKDERKKQNNNNNGGMAEHDGLFASYWMKDNLG